MAPRLPAQQSSFQLSSGLQLFLRSPQDLRSYLGRWLSRKRLGCSSRLARAGLVGPQENWLQHSAVRGRVIVCSMLAALSVRFLAQTLGTQGRPRSCLVLRGLWLRLLHLVASLVRSGPTERTQVAPEAGGADRLEPALLPKCQVSSRQFGQAAAA